MSPVSLKEPVFFDLGLVEWLMLFIAIGGLVLATIQTFHLRGLREEAKVQSRHLATLSLSKRH